jgi:hypothetical protein
MKPSLNLKILILLGYVALCAMLVLLNQQADAPGTVGYQGYQGYQSYKQAAFSTRPSGAGTESSARTAGRSAET